MTVTVTVTRTRLSAADAMNIRTDTKSKNKQPAKAADAKYESAESYKAGYGGKFGVQSDRFDSSAHRFDDEAVAGAGKTSQHSSVTDSKKGYGGAVRLALTLTLYISLHLLRTRPDPLHPLRTHCTRRYPVRNQVRAHSAYTCTRAPPFSSAIVNYARTCTVRVAGSQHPRSSLHWFTSARATSASHCESRPLI